MPKFLYILLCMLLKTGSVLQTNYLFLLVFECQKTTAQWGKVQLNLLKHQVTQEKEYSSKICPDNQISDSLFANNIMPYWIL